MTTEAMVERVARALYDAELAADKRLPISDASWVSIWSSTLRGMVRRHYGTLATAAIRAYEEALSAAGLKIERQPVTLADWMCVRDRAAFICAQMVLGDQTQCVSVPIDAAEPAALAAKGKE